MASPPDPLHWHRRAPSILEHSYCAVYVVGCRNYSWRVIRWNEVGPWNDRVALSKRGRVRCPSDKPDASSSLRPRSNRPDLNASRWSRVPLVLGPFHFCQIDVCGFQCNHQCPLADAQVLRCRHSCHSFVGDYLEMTFWLSLWVSACGSRRIGLHFV